MDEVDLSYRRQADFLLRENMNKLKGMVDLLELGILETMSKQEQDEFFKKMSHNMEVLYEKLEESISHSSRALGD